MLSQFQSLKPIYALLRNKNPSTIVIIPINLKAEMGSLRMRIPKIEATMVNPPVTSGTPTDKGAFFENIQKKNIPPNPHRTPARIEYKAPCFEYVKFATGKIFDVINPIKLVRKTPKAIKGRAYKEDILEEDTFRKKLYDDKTSTAIIAEVNQLMI